MQLLPHESHESHGAFDSSKLTPPPASAESKPSKAFDWAAERKRIFEKMNPPLLASFARPPPGSRHPNADKISKEGPGNEHEEKANDVENPWPMELPKPDEAEKEEEKKALTESDKK